MIPSFAEATAAARRIRYGAAFSEGDYQAEYGHQRKSDADLLAAFVLAGDTERLRAALEETAAALGIALAFIPGETARDSAREVQGRALALAEGGV